MSNKLSLQPAFQEELDETVSAYTQRFAGGGMDFLLAVEEVLDRIEKYPESFPIRSKHDSDIRGAQVKSTQQKLARAKKFPYLMIYHMDSSQAKSKGRTYLRT